MRRPTEAQAARIEAKIERIRADATKAFFKYQYGRSQALNAEADAIQHEYVEACGVSEIIKRQLLASLAATATRVEQAAISEMIDAGAR